MTEKEKKFTLRSRYVVFTYASDYLNNLTTDMVYEFFLNDKPKSNFVVVKAQGDKTDKHQHYHVFCDFNKTIHIEDKTHFDINLLKPVYANYINEDDNNVLGYSLEETLLEGAVRNKLIDHSHPHNLPNKVKSKKGIFGMINYVLYENNVLECKSNFNYQNYYTKLLTAEQTKKDNEIAREISKVIRDNKGKTEQEVLDIIENDKDLFYYWSRHYINYSNLLKKYTKSVDIKPKPYWGEYWIPTELANYFINILNPWVAHWIENKNKPLDKKQLKSRPQSVIICGPGNCGKTSLVMCFGEPAYVCNSWNRDHIENNCPYVVLDDFDNFTPPKKIYFNDKITYEDDFNDNFWQIKPLLAAQDVTGFSDKHKSAKQIENGRPCIFICNYPYKERFNKNSRDYIADINCLIIDLFDLKIKHLKEKPKYSKLGNINEIFTKYNTKSTWYYLNFVLKKYIDNNLLNIDNETINILENRKRKYLEDTNNNNKKMKLFNRYSV